MFSGQEIPTEVPVNLNVVFAHSEDVVVKEIRGEFVLFPVHSGIADIESAFFSLNEEGQRIWKRLDGRKSLKEIASELSVEFDASLDKIEDDILSLAEKLVRRKMLVERRTLSFSNEDNIELMRAVIAKGASFRFQANGYSMCPFIRFGDIVTIAPFEQKKIRVGAVVAFTHPCCGKLIVHRIVAQNGDSYRIKGDNVWESDGLVPRGDVLGYVKKTERKGRTIFLGLGIEGFLIAFLSSKLAFFSRLMAIWKWVSPVLGRRNNG